MRSSVDTLRFERSFVPADRTKSICSLPCLLMYGLDRYTEPPRLSPFFVSFWQVTDISLAFTRWSNESPAMTTLRAFSGMGRACEPTGISHTETFLTEFGIVKTESVTAGELKNHSLPPGFTFAQDKSGLAYVAFEN